MLHKWLTLLSPLSISPEGTPSTRTGAGGWLNVSLIGAFLIVVVGVVCLCLGNSAPATNSNQDNHSARHLGELISEDEMIDSPAGGTTRHGKELPPAAIYARCGGAVATVVTKDDLGFEAGLGSGFFVATSWVQSSYEDFSFMEKVAGSQKFSSSYLLTNYHVIRSAATAEVRLDDGRSGWVHDVVMEDQDLDLALVSCLIRSPKPHRFLSMAEGAEPRIGEKVYAIGSPQGLVASLSEGIISGRGEMPTGIRRLQTTAPISPGSSGAPLLNSSGEVVGVVQATSPGGQSLNSVIPASEVISFLEGPCNTRELWRGTGIREEEEDAYLHAITSGPWPVSESDIGIVLFRTHNHIREREYQKATKLLADTIPSQAG